MDTLKKIVVAVLTWEARIVLARFRPRIIAITGSVGKTSAKDAIYEAISQKVHVRKSEKSFNSGIGVPLTILGRENAWRNPVKWALNILKGAALIFFAREYPEWLVLEVGADRPGDIRRIAKWLRPDIVVLTGVPEIPAHVEYFDSPDAMLKEKRALAEALKRGGTLIVNGDDPSMREVRSKLEENSIAYGTESYNNFAATHIEIIYKNIISATAEPDSTTLAQVPIGMRFRMNHKGSSLPAALYGALGTPRIYSALAAFAVGKVLGLDFVSISEALAKWKPQSGRMRILRGIKGSIIIDDTYNSSPAAALSALDTLKEINCTSQKIAILGDMMELGKFAKEAHRTVGERAAGACDLLITVGVRARDIGEAALDAGLPETKIREYESNESARAGEELKLGLRAGDIVLVKGSQSVRMERAVYHLLAEPNSASELLVRQDDEWLNKS